MRAVHMKESPASRRKAHKLQSAPLRDPRRATANVAVESDVKANIVFIKNYFNN